MAPPFAMLENQCFSCVFWFAKESGHLSAVSIVCWLVNFAVKAFPPPFSGNSPTPLGTESVGHSALLPSMKDKGTDPSFPHPWRPHDNMCSSN